MLKNPLQQLLACPAQKAMPILLSASPSGCSTVRLALMIFDLSSANMCLGGSLFEILATKCVFLPSATRFGSIIGATEIPPVRSKRCIRTDTSYI